jgi:primosomal protein N' (replication factor Y)
MSLDFRATENIAQLLIQVSGRAGRSKDSGEVAIQTRYPNHPIFSHIKKSAYSKYAGALLKEREEAQLPPYAHQALICANSKNKQSAEQFLNEVLILLKSIDMDSVEIWGPVPGVIEKKSNYYYYNLYLQSTNRKDLHRLLKTFYLNIDTLKTSKSVRWYLDVDPIE